MKEALNTASTCRLSIILVLCVFGGEEEEGEGLTGSLALRLAT